MGEEALDTKTSLLRSAKELNVFKRAYALSLAIHTLSLQFPQIDQFSLADQLRRSSKSICANLVEGFAKQSQSKLEFKRFITISIASAQETDLWLIYAADLGYIEPDLHKNWEKELNTIISMLITLRNKI